MPDTRGTLEIADFTSAERWVIQNACNERWYRETVVLHPADVELQLNPGERSEFPALYWQVEDCSFVVIKTGEQRYRCQFFYKDDLEQLGTGIEEFDNLGDCVVALLRMQADHHSVRTGAYPGA